MPLQNPLPNTTLVNIRVETVSSSFEFFGFSEHSSAWHKSVEWVNL